MPSELKAAADRLRFTARNMRGELPNIFHAGEIPSRLAQRTKIEILLILADALDPEEDHGI